jgi:hypothetical protein
MNAKELIFRYNADPTTDEEVLDHEGKIPLPKFDDILERGGKKWRVVEIYADYSRPVLLYRVFVTDKL